VSATWTITESVKSRFASRVTPSDPASCWEWSGSRNADGYGYLRVGSQRDGTRSRVLAHRLAWMLAHGGAIPGGLFVLHRCDNPPCCNPAHLFLGTNADNVADMLAKGRHVSVRPSHCKAGHPLSGDNLYLTRSGKRMCRECDRRRGREWRERRRKAGAL